MPWNQVYDPLGNWMASTVLASLPIFVLLGTLAFLKLKAHWAAVLGLGSAVVIAIFVFGMPLGKGAEVTAFGAAYGLFPIGWIILNVIFLYTLTHDKGYFTVLQESLTGITQDRRLQLLLIAFSFGAFFEGAAGFGTPVAVTAAILIGLGFSPLAASGLSLVANTAPVAFGALGTPIIALAGVTGLEIHKLSAMVGRQLPLFSIIVPFWLVWAYAGFAGMIEVWPALLVAGAFFAVPQFLISNLHGPWLVDVVSSLCSIFALIAFLKLWHPKKPWRPKEGATEGQNSYKNQPPAAKQPVLMVQRQVNQTPDHVSGPSTSESAWGNESATEQRESVPRPKRAPKETVKAWLPWIILSVLVFIWGIPQVKAFLDGISIFKIPVPGVDKLINRMPPVVAGPAAEAAVFSFNWLSFTGTSIFMAAIISALIMGYGLRGMASAWWRTLKRVRFSLLTVSAMLALGFVTRYSGLDATMGLAFAKTGVFYPFFGTLLGWLGVALTGSDTSSNVLFGSLQRISAEQLGVSPVLMSAANSSGGVMGKMIDAQSIVVASTATKWYGHEGEILRYVFFHSLALAALVGLVVILQAYVFPFTRLVVK